MQLSVKADKVEAERFAAKAGTIRSCDDAKNLGKSLDAKINRNRLVRASALPSDLQSALRELPTGQATQVFSADGQVLRVLVICARV